MVGRILFTANPNNAVGTPVDELKVGDKVTVSYQTSSGGALNNASAITMVEAAPMAAMPLAGYVQEGCEAELQTYCSQVVPGQNRLLACLYAHGDKLSGQCELALYQSASALDRAISNVAYLADQCQADIESKCANVQPGQGRIAQCLADNKATLSPTCTQAIGQVQAQIE